jgi:hypothetical protein
MKKILALTLLAGAALVSNAQASLIDITVPGRTLADVLGHRFIVGDKEFTMPANAFSSAVFNANQIFIQPNVSGNPLAGQGFRLTGAWTDSPGFPGSDFTLAYDVQILPEFVAQGYRFDDAILRFNGVATGAGSFARVDETVMNGNNNIIDQVSVFSLGVQGGTGSSDLESVVDAHGLTRLRLLKDVHLFTNTGTNGVPGGYSSSISFIDQVFSQVVIPLPTTAAMGMVALGIGAVRRRR